VTGASASRSSPGPDLVPLNPRQRAAVEHGDGPLAVLAGAGTGKTRVLTHRVVRLIQHGADPWRVLAVTFTNKAASEMRTRLRELLGDDADTVWVGTFHAICARILRRYGDQAGLGTGFAIYDEADQQKLIERQIKALELDERVSPRQVLARIGRAKDRGADPAAPTGHPADDAVAQVWPGYQAQLARENAVDFADLLLRALDLLGAAPAGPVLARKFSHVLVDEFQDTNLVQYELVRRLSAATGNLTVVGDDDQAIYAWRGAEPANLLHFERDYPGASLVKLEQNYRSTRVVLACANAVIGHNEARHGKVLWTDRRGGAPAVVHRADDDRGEGDYVAGRIRHLVETDGIRYSDVAILYRTNQQSRVLEECLRRARIPARVVGGTSFFDRREVRDVLAYLRLVANPASDTSFERVVNVPARGIGDATLGKLRVAAKGDGKSLLAAATAAGAGAYSAVLPALARRRLGQFAGLIGDLVRTVRQGSSVAQLVTLAVEWSGLRAALEADRTVEGRDRAGHLAELASCAADFDDQVRASTAVADRPRARGAEEVEPWDEDVPRAPPAGPLVDADSARSTDAPVVDAEISRVSGFLERLALSQPGDEDPDAEAVSLLTIHVAKGLEWPVVFVAGLEDGLIPSLRDREDGDVAGAIEEERRLLYVAITRARDRLYLTYARTRRVWGEIRPCDPSRFLDELPKG
jgi:DNA helicase-2/ATP-dependent DNA helicase PcrA